jgi:hypothetical protein
MSEILSSILHVNHDPNSGNYFVTVLLHDGGHQVDKREYKGAMLSRLLSMATANMLAVSRVYFAYPGDETCRRAGDPFEQPELPF